MTSTATTLAKRIRNREFILAPGVFDMISAKVADRAGFKALYMTGSGVVASHLGVPGAEAFAKAGADVLFVEAPGDVAQMERLGRTFDTPLLVNMVEGGSTPVLPQAELERLGFRIAIFPASGVLATVAALEKVYAAL